MGLRRWIVLSLAFATLATYSLVAEHEFVNYDDRIYILENPQLHEPLSLESVKLAFQPYHSNWIPLTSLSLLLDYALFGASADGQKTRDIGGELGTRAFSNGVRERLSSSLNAG